LILWTGGHAETARAKFLDPIETPDVNQARAAVEATQFAADPLRTLLPRLQERYQQTDAAEQLARWRVDYDKFKIRRDVLAAELREVYPATICALVNLFARIGEFDAELSALHQRRPSGTKGLELEARGLEEYSRDQPSVARELKLPGWSASNKLVWPPRSTPVAVLVAESMVLRDAHYSADWHEAQKADIAKRVAEENAQFEAEAALQEENKRAYERSLPR
jgi:hypothetical protein